MGLSLSTNPRHLDALRASLGLGAQDAPLSRVYGGFHHRMWHLATATGAYAVKQLSPDADLSGAAGTNYFDLRETAAARFAEKGIATVVALRGEHGYLQVLDDTGYLVYPWTEARALARDAISIAHVAAVAAVLAGIHRSGVSLPGLGPAPLERHPDAKVEILVQTAVDYRLPYATALDCYLPELTAVATAHRAAQARLAGTLVLSHGDLDHKNVLWQNPDRPLLIDWESARELNPTHELLLEALDWSGITSRFAPERFRAMLLAYEEAGGHLHRSAADAVLDGILGDWLDWLLYNVGRAIDVQYAEQRSLALEQVELALSTLLQLRRRRPELLSMIMTRVHHV